MAFVHEIVRPAALVADALLRRVTPRLLRTRLGRPLTARVLVPGLLAIERFVFTRDDARH